MGMESFFVMMLANGIQQEKDKFGIRKYVGKSSININDLIIFLESNLNLKKHNIYVIDNILEMNIDVDENDNIKTVSFECCFFL